MLMFTKLFVLPCTWPSFSWEGEAAGPVFLALEQTLASLWEIPAEKNGTSQDYQILFGS